MQLHQLLQPVVAIDDAPVEVVQIRRGESATIERHQRTQLRWDHRQDIQNHPLRLVAGFAERFHYAQPLGELELFLLRSLGLHSLADFDAEAFDIHFLEKLFDSFRAHHGDELTRKILIKLALALVSDYFALGQLGHFTWIDHHECFEI